MAQPQLMGHMGFLPGGRLVAVDLINTVPYLRRRTPPPHPPTPQAACNPMQGARTVPSFLGALDFNTGVAGKYGTI